MTTRNFIEDSSNGQAECYRFKNFSSSAQEKKNLDYVFWTISIECMLWVQVTHRHAQVSDHLIVLLSSLILRFYEQLISAMPSIPEKVIYLHRKIVILFSYFWKRWNWRRIFRKKHRKKWYLCFGWHSAWFSSLYLGGSFYKLQKIVDCEGDQTRHTIF